MGTVSKPVNASKAPKGTIFGANKPMAQTHWKAKQGAKGKAPMSTKQKMAVKKKKVGNAAEKQMFGMK